MKIKKILIISFISILFISCEETVTNIQLPYVEQLVVSCILEDGNLVDSLRLERTLPPLDNYVEEKAIVKDAKVEISDGASSYQLYYENGYYKSNNLIPQAGKTYNLKIEWKGKIVKATTFIPYIVEIPEIKYTLKEKQDAWSKWYELEIYSLIKPVKNVVFNSGWLNNHMGMNNQFNHICRDIDVNTEGNCKVVFLNNFYIQSNDLNTITNFLKELVFVVYAYDTQFYPYFITQYNGESSDAIFGGSTNNISWNVKGDGIGLFLGRAVAFKTY